MTNTLLRISNQVHRRQFTFSVLQEQNFNRVVLIFEKNEDEHQFQFKMMNRAFTLIAPSAARAPASPARRSLSSRASSPPPPRPRPRRPRRPPPRPRPAPPPGPLPTRWRSWRRTWTPRSPTRRRTTARTPPPPPPPPGGPWWTPPARSTSP